MALPDDEWVDWRCKKFKNEQMATYISVMTEYFNLYLNIAYIWNAIIYLMEDAP